jgi:hypothetical protein
MLMNPDYPVYIVSKGRWHSRLTSKALDRMGVPYLMIVEAQEFDRYADAVGKNKLLVLPQQYRDQYDTCDNLGFSKSIGPGAARNFAWDHSIAHGHSKHWVLDDNFDAFHRLNRNMKVVVESGTIFKVAEDFIARYDNVPIAGFNYYSFCKATDPVPPFILNTRIYSCLLIDNAAPYRWRGRYNEDTDLSLRALKDGYCTIQFNAFLAGKVTTQRMAGGNTEEFYRTEGTLAKSQMLADLHPDVAKVVWKFNRWHHHVNYKPFKTNKLIKKPNLQINTVINEYGMKLTDLV